MVKTYCEFANVLGAAGEYHGAAPIGIANLELANVLHTAIDETLAETVRPSSDGK